MRVADRNSSSILSPIKTSRLCSSDRVAIQGPIYSHLSCSGVCSDATLSAAAVGGAAAPAAAAAAAVDGDGAAAASIAFVCAMYVYVGDGDAINGWV